MSTIKNQTDGNKFNENVIGFLTWSHSPHSNCCQQQALLQIKAYKHWNSQSRMSISDSRLFNFHRIQFSFYNRMTTETSQPHIDARNTQSRCTNKTENQRIKLIFYLLWRFFFSCFTPQQQQTRIPSRNFTFYYFLLSSFTKSNHLRHDNWGEPKFSFAFLKTKFCLINK